jgi:hypothetical protein
MWGMKHNLIIYSIVYIQTKLFFLANTIPNKNQINCLKTSVRLQANGSSELNGVFVSYAVHWPMKCLDLSEMVSLKKLSIG